MSEWSPEKINFQVHDKDLVIKPVRLILGVSKQRGVEVAHFVDGTFDSNSFGVFLRKIKKDKGLNPLVFLDNASYHRSQDTRRVLAQLKLPVVYNLPYRPDRNPVEVCFAALKQRVKLIRLRCIAHNSSYDTRKIVRDCVKELDLVSIHNFCSKGL